MLNCSGNYGYIEIVKNRFDCEFFYQTEIPKISNLRKRIFQSIPDILEYGNPLSTKIHNQIEKKLYDPNLTISTTIISILNYP